MTQKIISRIKSLLTLLTLETFIFHMNLCVFCEVCLLYERKRTVLALIRSLATVHPHVVKEVMPFSLHLPTVSVTAYKQTNYAFGSLIFKLKNSKILSGGYVHIYLDLIKVKIFAWVYYENGVVIEGFLFTIVQIVLYRKIELTVNLSSAHHQALFLHMRIAEEVFETFLVHFIRIIYIYLCRLITLALKAIYVGFWRLWKGQQFACFHFWREYRFFALVHFWLIFKFQHRHWKNVLFRLRCWFLHDLRLFRGQICS